MNNIFFTPLEKNCSSKVRGRIFLTGFALIIFSLFFTVKVFAQFPELSPEKIALAQNLHTQGQVYLEKGEYGKADDTLRQAQVMLEGSEFIQNQALAAPAVVSGELLEPSIVAVKVVEEVLEKPQEKVVEPIKKIKPKKLSRRERAKIALEEAQEFYRKNEFDSAIKSYQTVIKLYGEKRRGCYYNLGVIYLAKKEYLKSAEMFEKVISMNRRDHEAYYNLGVIYENFLYEQKKALRCYQLYVKFAPSGREKYEVSRWVEYIKMQEQ